MKVSKITIKDFHQFKELSLDLTYPKGHKNEGKPLSKICFIGQSGTGKTSLLELIPKFLYQYNTHLIHKSGLLSVGEKINFDIEFGLNNEYSANIEYVIKDKVEKDGVEIKKVLTRAWGDYKLNGQQISFEEIVKFYTTEWLDKIATKLIYFPANLNYEIEVNQENTLKNRAIIDFSKENVSTVWNYILERIQLYQEQELQFRQEISKTIEQDSININVIKKAVKKLEDWKKKQFNPIIDIADNCLNKLLSPFNLKVKTELDIKIKDDIGFIKIEDFFGNEIPHGLWSTGTKQVVLSALPLYLLKPKHTIILFDEPERSLYPDLQRFIIDYYSSLTDDCQFFYSTHSPVIASSFEPWEIVELKFDKKGNIYRELYYEGKNHIDNYKLNPQHMRWDDILQRIFDMENDGSEIRKQKLDELATNNVKYRKLEKTGKLETIEAKDILKTIQKLSEELSNWN